MGTTAEEEDTVDHQGVDEVAAVEAEVAEGEEA